MSNLETVAKQFATKLDGSTYSSIMTTPYGTFTFESAASKFNNQCLDLAMNKYTEEVHKMSEIPQCDREHAYVMLRHLPRCLNRNVLIETLVQRLLDTDWNVREYASLVA